MKSTLLTLLLGAALLARAFAQTPTGFTPDVQTSLGVLFGPWGVSLTPGTLLPREDTADAPYLTLGANVSSTGLYIAFMIDSDVPRNDGLTTLLHWFQPNLLPSPKTLVNTPSAPNMSTAVGAPYLQPSPPYGSGPHEYTILLFTQPEGFTVPTSYLSINPPPTASARVGFNISNFMDISGLNAPVAANYFRVLNGTAAETSSVESTGPTASRASLGTATASTTAASTTASTTLTGTAAASSSASASATGTGSTGAASDVRGNTREVLAGLALVVVGATMWMA